MWYLLVGLFAEVGTLYSELVGVCARNDGGSVRNCSDEYWLGTICEPIYGVLDALGWECCEEG